MKLDEILVSVIKFDENFFSAFFFNHVTSWCQITNTGNTILEVANLVSSTTGNIFNTFMIDESNIFSEKKRKKSCG